MNRYSSDEDYDDEETMDEEAIIENVLGESLRANELRLLRTTLETRRNALRVELKRLTDPKEQERLTARLKDLAKQIAILREEEAITGFVEKSVRFTLHNPAQDELS